MNTEKDGTRAYRYSTEHPIDASVPANSQLWLRSVKVGFKEKKEAKKDGDKDTDFARIALGALETNPTGLLENWSPLQNGKAHFRDAGDGWYVLKGGLGGVHSAEEFSHFLLQFEAKLIGKAASAEIVVRAPATMADNGIALSLRAASEGHLDLGSVANKQKARVSHARLGQPFYLTVVVCENDVAVWVNGMQVTDYSAVPVADNKPIPRTPVILRLLDPGTELSVRNVRYVKMIGERLPPTRAGKKD
jgi:hypothetical protein